MNPHLSQRQRRQWEWPLALLSIWVLVIGLAYAYGSVFLFPYPGFHLGPNWTVGEIDHCDEYSGWCEANPGRVQTGDQLLRIGSLTYEDYQNNRLAVPLEGHSPGDRIPVTFQRGEAVQTIEWLLPITTFWQRVWGLAVMWPFVPFWLAGTAVLFLLRPRDLRWRLLILFNYLTAVWLAAGLISVSHILGSALLLRAASWLMMPIYLHLHLVVPIPIFPRFTRYGIPLLYAAALIGAAIEFLYPLPGSTIYLLAALAAIVGSFCLLALRLFAGSPAGRLAARLMLTGVVLAFGPGLMLWLIPTLLNIPTRNELTTVISALAVPLLPFFYTYAIYKRHLGVAEFRANRLLSLYSFTLIYLTALTLAFAVGSRWLGGSNAAIAYNLVVSAIFVLAAPMLRQHYRRLVDRLAYGATYNPNEIVQVFAAHLPTLADRAALVHLLADKILPSLLIRQSALYRLSGEQAQLVYGRGLEPGLPHATLRQLRGLLAQAGRYRSPSDVPGSDGFAWVRLAVPLEIERKVVGLWLFGQRDPDDYYPQHDTQLLGTLAGQAAVALENTWLYDSLQQTADEIATLYRASDWLLRPGSDVPSVAGHIARAVQQELKIADCVVLLMDEARTELRPMGQARSFGLLDGRPLLLADLGLTITAARTGEVVYAPDVAARPDYLAGNPRTRSELAIPLRVADAHQPAGQRVIGVLNLESPEPDAFDERTRRIVTAFAERAALALENAQLVARLEAARQMAEGANQLKSEFLANTSHELRTPLTGILGSLGVVLDGLCDSPEEEREFLQIAYTSGRNLLTIVNDVLDIAKIEAGKMDMILQPVGVAPILNEVQMLTRLQAEAKQLNLEIQPLPEAVPPVCADPDKLRQILLNLVGNAIKFTEQGSIVVEAQVVESWLADAERVEHLQIAIRDTGIGIPPDKQGKLFQPFVQVDGSRTRHYGGTGLGLSISRHLAELMYGTLNLYSAGAGQGSTFTLTLPVAPTKPESSALPKPALEIVTPNPL